jgi:hypothetical protein
MKSLSAADSAHQTWPNKIIARRKASFDGKLLKKGRPKPPRCDATV